MSGNSNLHDSAKNKQDEFYTRLQLVEDELKHYRSHFKGKRVLCNCDDPYESNFFKYFAMNFNALGLKSLTATCFATSPVVYTQLDLFGDNGGPVEADLPNKRRGRAASMKPPRKIPYKIVITEVKDENGDGRVDLADVEWLIRNKKNVLARLEGDGDFRSSECVALLNEADIVVTNPPFSLFREFMALLMEHGKQFLVIGNITLLSALKYFRLFVTTRFGWGTIAGTSGLKYLIVTKRKRRISRSRMDRNGVGWVISVGLRISILRSGTSRCCCGRIIHLDIICVTTTMMLSR